MREAVGAVEREDILDQPGLRIDYGYLAIGMDGCVVVRVVDSTGAGDGYKKTIQEMIVDRLLDAAAQRLGNMDRAENRGRGRDRDERHEQVGVVVPGDQGHMVVRVEGHLIGTLDAARVHHGRDVCAWDAVRVEREYLYSAVAVSRP